MSVSVVSVSVVSVSVVSVSWGDLKNVVNVEGGYFEHLRDSIICVYVSSWNGFPAVIVPTSLANSLRDNSEPTIGRPC